MEHTNPPFDISLNLLTEVFEIAPDIAVNLLSKNYKVLWANRVMSIAVEKPLGEMIGAINPHTRHARKKMVISPVEKCNEGAVRHLFDKFDTIVEGHITPSTISTLKN